jgi:membrane protein implicated in regulation of membrane protease activity
MSTAGASTRPGRWVLRALTVVAGLLFMGPVAFAVWWMISFACDSWKGKTIWFVILAVTNWAVWFLVVEPRLHPPQVETPYERSIRGMHELFPDKS